MLEITQANMPAEEAYDDSEYWSDHEEFMQGLTENRYCRLKLIGMSNSPTLLLEPLKKHGLKSAPQSPQKLTPPLLQYLKSEFASHYQDLEFMDEETPVLTEGLKKMVYVNRYERNPIAREACIREKGCVCAVCYFDFSKKYGPFGKGFIHVHHIVPLSSIAEDYVVDYKTDLIPVCPNCHAMLHHKVNGQVLTIEELKTMIGTDQY